MDQCKSGNQDAVICKKELGLCRNELKDEQNKNNQLEKKFHNIEKKALQLEGENTRILFESFRNQTSYAEELRISTDENRNLRNALGTCENGIDESDDGTHNCDRNAQCTCNNGYTGKILIQYIIYTTPP